MSTINGFKVNGVTYALHGDNIYVGRTEPTGDLLPDIWIKPSSIWALREQSYSYMYSSESLKDAIGMEEKVGHESGSDGDYTLDAEGNLVETADDTETGTRTTKMFPIWHDKNYKLSYIENYNFGGSEYTWTVYFYNLNKELITTATYTTGGETADHNIGDTALELTLPEGTRQIRILAPYHFENLLALCELDVTTAEITKFKYFGSHREMYEHDVDHYVRI